MSMSRITYCFLFFLALTSLNVSYATSIPDSTRWVFYDSVESIRMRTYSRHSNTKGGMGAKEEGMSNYPDNVSQQPCSFPVESSEWSIALDTMINDDICTLITPLVGDLDGDGVAEIVCFSNKLVNGNSAISGGGNPGTKVRNVVVYDGFTHQRKAKFDLPMYVSAFEATPYGLARCANGDALMVFACTDNKLYAYKYDSHTGVSQVWGGVSFGSGNDYATVVGFADFNNDGSPELYVRNKIFDLATGQLLLTVNTTNQGATYAHVGSSTSSISDRMQLAASLACDIVGDSKCELLLGNKIYSIDITNTSGTAGNSATLYATAPSTGYQSIPADGHAQVADFNLDGYLDVLLSCRPNVDNQGKIYAYVWDVHNSTVSAPIAQSVSQPGKSIPLIADIDNDDSLEVVIHCGVPGQNVRAYKYHASSSSFSLLWTKGFSEDSYSNGLTLFDFNQDGENELLICDQNNISIVNGSTPALAQNAIAIFPFKEVTTMQYPVIVDVNNDGAAEIVFVGNETTATIQGSLNILHSGGTPWAPARPVWNQYMYNSTNVNKDLSIPAVPFNNAHVFIDNTGGNTVFRRPFNNFLQQATYVDTNGAPYRGAGDLIPTDFSLTETDEGMLLQFEVCNIGTSTFLTDTLHISLHINSYQGDWIGTINSFITDGSAFYILADSCYNSSILLPFDLFCRYIPFDSICFSINDVGLGVGAGGVPPECDFENNFITLTAHLEPIVTEYYDTICTGQSYRENGFDIAASRTMNPGSIVDTVFDSEDCRYFSVLYLFVVESGTVDTSVTACDIYEWHGEVYVESGNYVYESSSLSGCRIVETLHLNISSSYFVEEEENLCQGSAITVHGIRVSEPGVYRFDFTTTNGCDSVFETTVIERPVYNRVDSVKMCTGNPEVGYRWVNGETYYYSTDTPACRLSSVYGCDSMLRLNLTIDRSLRAKIHCEPEFPTYDNFHVCLSNATSNYLTQCWYLFDGTVCDDPFYCFNVPFDNDSVWARLVVSSGTGCFDTATLYIPMDRSTIYIPNVFTPNLATNSMFRVYGNSLLEVQAAIFTREGIMVTEFDALNEGWNGTHNGEICQQGTYVYKVRYRSVIRSDEWQVLTGTVTLLR